MWMTLEFSEIFQGKKKSIKNVAMKKIVYMDYVKLSMYAFGNRGLYLHTKWLISSVPTNILKTPNSFQWPPCYT